MGGLPLSACCQNGPQILARKLPALPRLLWASPGRSASSFKASDLQVELNQAPQKKPELGESLPFGKHFTDHMLSVEWCSQEGWAVPHIHPFRSLVLHPACSALHYGIELFEGMKAFRGKDQRVRLFRPWLNMDRMLRSSLRLCLPAFDKLELLECIRRLVEIDVQWVPSGDKRKASLYIRPTFIGNEACLGVHPPLKALLYVILCPVGSYFSGDALTPVSLLADPRFVRSWTGGVGDCKLGGAGASDSPTGRHHPPRGDSAEPARPGPDVGGVPSVGAEGVHGGAGPGPPRGPGARGLWLGHGLPGVPRGQRPVPGGAPSYSHRGEWARAHPQVPEGSE
ncbi:branched-chain-amino-acid aminotransferase, mitochondrial isoform X4 [Antechinus flavipes]|uniref:branched-chain-amino-acid aminotransferase, mitochondrial isoform X4 n=1 Tax=Antechinus flavipes TaxID=38775 RepID=UPI0022354D7A|nr:branched-chain-amino-acid aminotransferase, mitochondrial isoform X4 [Antechinus flavipes]